MSEIASCIRQLTIFLGGQGQVFRATYNLGLPDERRGVVKSTLVRSDDGAAYIYDYRTTRKRRRDGLLESEAAVREIEFLQQLKAARRERVSSWIVSDARIYGSLTP